MIDPYWDNVVLAMPMDGIDGSTSFSDLTGKVITPYGNARLSTAQAKFDGVSAFFDGTGDFLTVPAGSLAMGTEDFTVECYVRPTSDPDANGNAIVSTGSTTSTRPFGLYQGNTFWSFWFQNTGSVFTEVSVPFTGSQANKWTHLAGIREGDAIYLAVDGVLSAGVSVSGVAKSTTLLYVGRFGWNPVGDLAGYIDDLRITKGVARYTANFTLPAQSYLSNNVGAIVPPIHSIESIGTAPIVGIGEIVPATESVSGDDGAIIASVEMSPPIETITASGTSEAVPAVNHAAITPKLESISGYGYTSVVGFGSIIPKRRGTISGSGTSGEWIGHGTIAPRLESVTASGGTAIIGRAVLEGKKDTVNGSGSSAIAGTGRIVGRAPFISGLGFMGVGGSAQIQTLKDIVSGSGTSYISGSAAIIPPKEKISASKYIPLVHTTLNFSRGAVVTGGTPAPPVEPFHFSR